MNYEKYASRIPPVIAAAAKVPCSHGPRLAASRKPKGSLVKPDCPAFEPITTLTYKTDLIKILLSGQLYNIHTKGLKD